MWKSNIIYYNYCSFQTNFAHDKLFMENASDYVIAFDLGRFLAT